MNHRENNSRNNNDSSPCQEAVAASLGALEVLAETASGAIISSNNAVSSSATSCVSDINQHPCTDNIEDVDNNERQFDESRETSGKQLKKNDVDKNIGDEKVEIQMNASKTELRKGKWTSEEEDYAASVIHFFSSGLITLPKGKTLRSYLAEKLQCDPMRVTKKYAGAACLGKRIHRLFDIPQFTPEEINMAKLEIDRLEERFRMRLALGDGAILPPLQPAPIIHGNTKSVETATLGLRNQASTSNNNPQSSIGNGLSGTQPSSNPAMVPTWNANSSFMNAATASSQPSQLTTTSNNAAITLLRSLTSNPQLLESLAKNPNFPLIIGALNQSAGPVPPPNQTQFNGSFQQILRQMNNPVSLPSVAANIQQQIQPDPRHQVNQLPPFLSAAMQQAMFPNNSNISAPARQPTAAPLSSFSSGNESSNKDNAAQTRAAQIDPLSQKLDEASLKTLQQIVQSQLMRSNLNSTVSPSLLTALQNLAAHQTPSQSCLPQQYQNISANPPQPQSIQDVFRMISAQQRVQAPSAHALNPNDTHRVSANHTSKTSLPSNHTLYSNLAMALNTGIHNAPTHSTNQHQGHTSFLPVQAQTSAHRTAPSQQNALAQAISNLVKENPSLLQSSTGVNALNEKKLFQNGQTHASGLTLNDQEKKIHINSSTLSDNSRTDHKPFSSVRQTTTSTMSKSADESKHAMSQSDGTRQLDDRSGNTGSTSDNNYLPLSGAYDAKQPIKKRPKFTKDGDGL